MLEKVIDLSLQYRYLVVAIAALLIGAGVYALSRLPIDAFPDTTPVQVQINAVAPSLSPIEIEQQVTFPIEQVISGLPDLDEVRSISKFGLSQVVATFEDGADLYLARQLVSERLNAVELPQGIGPPQLGPIATGLGEVFHYIVSGDANWTLEQLTTLHNWAIKPQLASVPGVAEVNTWGGQIKQYQVHIDPNNLLKYSITIDDLIEALQKNNLSVGGGNISYAGELHLIRGASLLTNQQQISDVVIAAHNGVPVKVRDVAHVQIGHEIRRGAATANGRGEVVLGLAFMLMGENAHDVTTRLRQRLELVRKSLPEGVVVSPVYERTELVDQVIATVEDNLMHGALLVVAVLFIFLGNLRAGLIVAAAIPLSMVFAFNGMLAAGIAGSLLSLGAIDFGLVVDSSVIMVENCMRRLALDNKEQSKLQVIRDAAVEVRRPTMFGEMIIMIVYLPILTLEGIEGKLFQPMALTVIFALGGSLILSLTLMPALCSIVLPRRARHGENLIVRLVKWLYRPFLRFAIRARALLIVLAMAFMGGGVWLGGKLGAEFVPRLSEMSITVNTIRLAGVSLEESVRYGTQLEKLILEKYPDEVRDVWVRTGTAATATDPMGIELSDMFITLAPRHRWTRAQTQQQLVDLMSRELGGLPGMRLVYTQPIEMRINEMVAGIRSDLGIKLFGDDLDLLREKAAEIQAVLETIPGSADLYTEQITGQPVLDIQVDQQALARYGVPGQHAVELIEAIGGIKVSQIREGQRRFDLVVRLTEQYRQTPDDVRRILVNAADGQRIPLLRLAHIRHVEGPSTITREWQRRRIVVQANVRGRDIGSFVAEARQRIDQQIDLPPGYFIEFSGQFEHLQRARARLMIVVPLALGLILMLLYISTHSIRDTLIIFTGAPLAAVGGVAALYWRDMPFTISAAVGFIALSGVAMLGGLVMVSTIRRLRDEGLSIEQATEQGALLRLRPVLMTALVASLGFVPMALNTSVGAEVQRPLATVVVAGMITNCILTLLIVPALYVVFASPDPSPNDGREQRD